MQTARRSSWRRRSWRRRSCRGRGGGGGSPATQISCYAGTARPTDRETWMRRPSCTVHTNHHAPGIAAACHALRLPNCATCPVHSTAEEQGGVCSKLTPRGTTVYVTYTAREVCKSNVDHSSRSCLWGVRVQMCELCQSFPTNRANLTKVARVEGLDAFKTRIGHQLRSQRPCSNPLLRRALAIKESDGESAPFRGNGVKRPSGFFPL